MTDTDTNVEDAPVPTDEGPISDPTPEAEAEEGTPESRTPEDSDTFPREVVEKLRQENGKYRQRAQQADTLAQRLHVELVRATGRLADPSDLPFDAAHLEDPEALAAAVDDLLDRKPHLASRRPTGDIGQGQRGPAGAGGFSLLGLLKERV